MRAIPPPATGEQRPNHRSLCPPPVSISGHLTRGHPGGLIFFQRFLSWYANRYHSRVQKKHSQPLPLGSRVRNVFRLVLWLLAPAALGQNAILISAPVNYDQIARTSIASQNGISPIGCFVLTPQLQSQVESLEIDRSNTISFLSDPSPEAPARLYRNDWSQFVLKRTSESARPGFWAHLQAGYGQFYRSERLFGESAMELEQPGCAYLKARFSF